MMTESTQGSGPTRSAHGWAVARNSTAPVRGWASFPGTNLTGPSTPSTAACAIKTQASGVTRVGTLPWGTHCRQSDATGIGALPWHSPLASIAAAFPSLLAWTKNALVQPDAATAMATTRSVPTLSSSSSSFSSDGSDPGTHRPVRSAHGVQNTWAPFASYSMASAAPAPPAAQGPTGGAASAAAAAKADVGRATWTLLHTLAAQFPERPTRQQQRDARTLVDCLTRIYPCGDCARHFAELVKRDPPVVSSGAAFRRWLCQIHNRVNARLGKPTFNCDLVESRWAPLGCSAVEAAAGEEGLPAAGGLDSGCELLGVGARGPPRRRT